MLLLHIFFAPAARLPTSPEPSLSWPVPFLGLARLHCFWAGWRVLGSARLLQNKKKKESEGGVK